MVEEASDRLRAAGVASPRVDAELLLAHCLGFSGRGRPPQSTVDGPVLAQFDQLVERRVKREPLQYIVGRADFRYVDLDVGPGVFIPRPETELLVDAVLPVVTRGSVVVDLCSGSGVLAVAIADEVPGVQVFAVERSSDALPWLRRNAARAASVASESRGTGRTAASTITVVEGDVTDDALLAELAGRVDAVVSNPPYVPAGTAVAPEVHADPAEAVFAGADGLDVIPAVIARAAGLLRPGGMLALEHDETHDAAVPALLAADGRWREVADHRDLTGRPRYATAVRAAR